MGYLEFITRVWFFRNARNESHSHGRLAATPGMKTVAAGTYGDCKEPESDAVAI